MMSATKDWIEKSSKIVNYWRQRPFLFDSIAEFLVHCWNMHFTKVFKLIKIKLHCLMGMINCGK